MDSKKGFNKKIILISALAVVLIVVVIITICLFKGAAKDAKQQEFTANVSSIEFLTEFMSQKPKLSDYKYFTDYPNWSFHEDRANTLVYTLRVIEGDQTESIEFTFDGPGGTLSRIWSNDFDIFVDFFMPAVSGKDYSDDELSRIMVANLGLGVSLNGDGSYQLHNVGQYNGCSIEVQNYKVEFAEWFFGHEFTITPLEE